jgi:hypothetical protein
MDADRTLRVSDFSRFLLRTPGEFNASQGFFICRDVKAAFLATVLR